jgi:hypothetical protein
MAGGAVNQAKRRSNDAETAQEEASIINVGGNPIELDSATPNQDQLLHELARKRTLGMTLPEKLTKIIGPAVTGRKEILSIVKAQTRSDPITSKIANAIPNEIPKTMAGPQIALKILEIHTALKASVEGTHRPSHQVSKVFSRFDDAIKSAISHFQADRQTKSKSCFPPLSASEKARKYKQRGYLPSDPAHRICIICNHEYCDEPDSNKTLQKKYADEQLQYNLKKQAAKEEAAKTKTKERRINPPKCLPPYRQCHCQQLYCVTVGSKLGSSCPLDCIDPNTGMSYGTDETGACACPICKCQCSVAFTYNAAQIVQTKKLLDDSSVQLQQEIDIQKSRSVMASLFKEATNNTLLAALASGKQFSQQTLERMAATASVQSLAVNFDPNVHSSLVTAMRNEIGLPTTKVHLPVPIEVDGKMTTVLDTHSISGRKGVHRKNNNRLTSGAEPSVNFNSRLHPYKDVYDGTSNIQFFGSTTPKNKNDTLEGAYDTEDNDFKTAMANSMETLNEDDIQLARAIRASINDSKAIRINNDLFISPRATRSSTANIVHVLPVVQTPLNQNCSPTTTTDPTEYHKRVQKKAYIHSKETVEIVDLENPGHSPEQIAKSPYAFKVFTGIAERNKNPALSDYVSHFHKENPQADSQEGYEAANDYLRALDGKPKKKRRSKSRR